MPVSLGTQGQPGFDTPFALMSDCHRRIEGFLAVIRRALERCSTGPLDDEAGAALRAAQRYFREAAPRHTEDEEESLFPRLRAVGGESLGGLLREAERLEREHDEAERLYAAIDERIDAWLLEGRLRKGEGEFILRDLDALDRLYARHIAFEDETLFPAAEGALDASQIREIGQEMAARRGLRASREG